MTAKRAADEGAPSTGRYRDPAFEAFAREFSARFRNEVTAQTRKIVVTIVVGSAATVLAMGGFMLAAADRLAG